jgi:molecular chaperone GrpE
MSDSSKKDWGKVKKEPMEQADMEIDAVLNDQIRDERDEEALVLDHASYQALEEKLTLAEQKAHESWEKLVRAKAEEDNIRKQAERQIANAHRYGLEKFINTLLPVVDSLEHAIVLALKGSDTGLLEGLELTMKLMLDALAKADVQPIDPLGMMFNPQLHEAMSIQDSTDVPGNTVLTVFQKGYLLNDRMIRPARVIVSKEKI